MDVSLEHPARERFRHERMHARSGRPLLEENRLCQMWQVVLLERPAPGAHFVEHSARGKGVRALIDTPGLRRLVAWRVADRESARSMWWLARVPRGRMAAAMNKDVMRGTLAALARPTCLTALVRSVWANKSGRAARGQRSQRM